ncbi:MAG: tRNA 2-thiouridine(34) synthase MnmA [Planctomycetota bacterium]|nr:tRNA 2-thiouridine(34) synthase MnmA [Planctomycetota bacterium]
MPIPRGKVLLAMSGGVDSSVAAALLLREGYEVVGCFMRLGTVGESLGVVDGGGGANPRTEVRGSEAVGAVGVVGVVGSDGPLACARGSTAEVGSNKRGEVSISHRGCCSVSDAADARLVAAQLGIPFYVCNFKKDFGRIIDYFVDEYAGGRTPNPCVRCNDWLKFGKLHEYARELGCDFVASGHYARIVRDEDGDGKENGEPMLARGIDADKDQSYVLFGVPRAQLGSMLLPIGGMHKADVRAMAEELGLPVFDKPDSQEICFVPDDDYAGLVERRRPGLAAASGEIVDTEGTVLGEHGGQHRFTIGQRRKIGVALGHPIYVVDRDPATNRVTVGGAEDLLVGSCEVGEANWLADVWGNGGGNGGGEEVAVTAQYRAHGDPVGAWVRRLPDAGEPGASGRVGRFTVRFDEPQRAVAPGQAIVLYDAQGGGVVIGGGWIGVTRPPSGS